MKAEGLRAYCSLWVKHKVEGSRSQVKAESVEGGLLSFYVHIPTITS